MHVNNLQKFFSALSVGQPNKTHRGPVLGPLATKTGIRKQIDWTF